MTLRLIDSALVHACYNVHEAYIPLLANGIEVKAGNTASVSLNNFIRDYQPSAAYKLVNGNVGISDVKRTLPHYMVMFL